MFKRLFNLLFFAAHVYSHGRLTSPIPRLKNVDGGLNAPIYTCLGPAFKTSSTSMRCHDTSASSPSITVNAGDTIQVELTIEAPHPGDCSLWLSYDTNVDSPQNWIKLYDYPGCFSPNGIDTFQGRKSIPVFFPQSLPSCEHCVLRWEWYTVQQVSNVEFYVNCVDIKIVNNLNNNCNIPGPTTQINGIEHLLYNLHDQTQKGCPFYNAYDINFRPPLDKRSRGPLEWIPNCNSQNPPIVPTIHPTPVIVYPCTNVNCGTNGRCDNANCICINGFTGLKCEIAPQIQCNVNCNINRNTCKINNLCDTCKNGFIGTESGNTLCPVVCTKNCKSLNRRTCITSNKCGVCIDKFMEPISHKKNEMCLPNMNTNKISLSISAQWDTGFCGRWILSCPQNREISFIVPENIREIRAWNINNMQKISNKIIGNCPYWTATGAEARGGFCAVFDQGKKVFIGNNGFLFTNSNFRNLLLKNEELNLDPYYQNVSIVMNVKNILYNNINYDNIENNLNMNSYGSSITILDNIINEDGTSDISIVVNCKNRVEFDASLFLQADSIKSLEGNLDKNLFYIDPVCNKEDEILNSGNRIKNNFLIFIFPLIILII